MKKTQTITFLGLILLFPYLGFSQNSTTQSSSQKEEYKVITITQDEFIEKVFDYKKNKDWVFKGNKPVIVDFYADWCAPCKMLAPILDELQKDYKDKIQIYKVNTDKNRELSSVFNVSSIPTILFIPMNDNPSMQRGLMSKGDLENIIENFLKVKK